MATITTQARFNGVKPTKNGKGTQATFVINNKDKQGNETTTWINALLSDDLNNYLSNKWKPGTNAVISFTTSFDNYFANIKDSNKGKTYQLSGILASAEKVFSYSNDKSQENTNTANTKKHEPITEANVDTDIEADF